MTQVTPRCSGGPFSLRGQAGFTRLGLVLGLALVGAAVAGLVWCVIDRPTVLDSYSPNESSSQRSTEAVFVANTSVDVGWQILGLEPINGEQESVVSKVFRVLNKRPRQSHHFPIYGYLLITLAAVLLVASGGWLIGYYEWRIRGGLLTGFGFVLLLSEYGLIVWLLR